MITIVGIIFTDLLTGIILGLIIAIIIILRNSYRNSHFLHIEESGNGRKKIKMTLAEEVTFLNKGAVRNALDNIPDGATITIDMSKSFRIDLDVQEIIDDFIISAPDRDIKAQLVQKKTNNDGKTN
jgi:MFS superfamily sulfate permease-like transporter